MYGRARFKDTVEVPPQHLGDAIPERVKRLLQNKLGGQIDENVGSIMSVVNANDIDGGIALPNRPGVHYKADFDAITHDPDVQEVIDGIVAKAVGSGAFVGIDPVDGLLRILQISDEHLICSDENRQLMSTESNQTLAIDDEARAHIVTKSIDERSPRDSKIGFAAEQSGLDKHGWLESRR